MRSARSWVALGSAGLAMTAATAAMGAPAATAAHGSHHPAVHKTASAALQRSKPDGKIAAGSRVSFQLVMNLRHAAKQASFARRVSTPGSKAFHHYLSDRQWENRYAPTTAQIRAAKTWLTRHHFAVGAVPSDRLFVTGTGTAAHVEKVFNTSLGRYKVNGRVVRLASGNIAVPNALAGHVSGIAGINQYLNTPDITQGAGTSAASAATPADTEPAPPAGFRNPQPCSAYWGQKVDTADSPALYKPFAGKRSYDICGYTPSQLRSSYGIQKQVSAGTNGSGVGLAIVDAYDSPTLLADAQHYETLNDPGNVIKSSQFINVQPSTVDDTAECDASGWFAEQSLDVEASHSMAPGATILYVGAQDCQDTGLLTALTTAVTSGASVVSDSWGDTLGDLFEDAASKTAFDDTFMLAASTGVSVLFSSGDDGDNFADFGIAAPDYPPSSPFVTAVGGTSLEVGSTGARNTEVGWSTGKQTLCAGVATTSCGSSSTTGTPLAFNAGGGGGTSYTYTQPFYQANVVPNALATRNSALFGTTPTRTVPDISMDADAQTGMLIGLTQTFPTGVQYDQFKEGGTSLASPLLAGVIADTDQASGQALGFLNPSLYKADTAAADKGSILDVVPPAVPADSATIRVDYANTVDATNGYNVSLRVLDYQGPETNCDGTGNCETRNVTLTTTKGYDGITGLGTVGANFIADLAKF
jgi:subtilase family serine protease